MCIRDSMKSVFAGNKAKFAYFSFIFIIISTAMYTFYAKEPHGWYIVWNDILAVIPLFAADVYKRQAETLFDYLDRDTLIFTSEFNNISELSLIHI